MVVTSSGNDYFAFELRFLVQNFGRKQRSRQGRAEDTTDARTEPCRQQDPTLPARQSELVGEKRTETGTDEGDRALSPAGTSGAERNRRCDRLHDWHSSTYAAVFVMKRLDRRVRAVPLGFGCVPINDPAGNKPSECGN